jgi:predicted double-glycine peptidase
MFTRMMSILLASIYRHSKNPSNLSTEEMGSVFEQNEEFARWWKKWVGRVQSSRAHARNFTETSTGA